MRAATILLMLAIAGSAGAQSLALSPQPTLRIGSETSPEYQFNRIQHLRRMSDGRILVTMGPDIRFFDAAGKYLAKAGGRGRGPGEFQYITDLFVMPGDTLYTMNVRTIVVLDRDGKFVRQVQPDLTPLQSGDWFSEGMVLLPNGNLLGPQYSRREGNARNPELHRPTLRYALLDLAKGQLVPLITTGGIAQKTTNGRSVVMPFTPHGQHAIGADRVYVGDNDSTTIHAFTLDGKPAGSFVVADKARPVTAADLDRYKQSLLDWAEMNKRPRETVEQDWAITPKPSRMPYWGTALVDRTGALWISGPEARPATPTSWTVFDKSGRRLGALDVPAGFKPKDIGADYVLGIQVDDDGVETISMYALRRSPR